MSLTATQALLGIKLSVLCQFDRKKELFESCFNLHLISYPTRLKQEAFQAICGAASAA